MMASRLAAAIERGFTSGRQVITCYEGFMESGALGCEIDIAGKLTGPRKRTEKFVAGNMLHAGNPAMETCRQRFCDRHQETWYHWMPRADRPSLGQTSGQVQYSKGPGNPA